MSVLPQIVCWGLDECLAFKCLSRSLRRTRIFPHSSHLYGVSPSACSLTCLFKLLGSPKGRRQNLQFRGLYPVCVLKSHKNDILYYIWCCLIKQIILCEQQVQHTYLMCIFSPYLREYSLPQ